MNDRKAFVEMCAKLEILPGEPAWKLWQAAECVGMASAVAVCKEQLNGHFYAEARAKDGVELCVEELEEVLTTMTARQQ